MAVSVPEGSVPCQSYGSTLEILQGRFVLWEQRITRYRYRLDRVRCPSGRPKLTPEEFASSSRSIKDWEGLKITLESLGRLNPRPGAIMVANDNSDTRVPSWLKAYPIQVINYRNNRGPAYARNRGAENPVTACDWIYFTDCGCEHVRNLITHFRNAQERDGDAVVGVCGTVTGKGSGQDQSVHDRDGYPQSAV